MMNQHIKFKLFFFLLVAYLAVIQAWGLTITETQFDNVLGEFTEANASVTNLDTLQKTHPDHLLVESMVWNGGWVPTDGPLWGGVATKDAVKDAGSDWWAFNGMTTIGVDGIGDGYLDFRWKDEYEIWGGEAYDGWDLDSISILVGDNTTGIDRVNYKFHIQVLSHDWQTWTTIDGDPDTPGVQTWLEGGSDRVGVGTKIVIEDIGIENIRGFRITANGLLQAAYDNAGNPITPIWGATHISEIDVNLTGADDPNTSNDYTGGANRAELEYLLARAINMSGFAIGEGVAGHYFDDNLRMIQNLQPNYIGRAAFSWDVYPSATDPNMADDEAFYDAAEYYAGLVHAEMPDLVLEGCVFETAYSAYDPDTQDRIDMGFNGAGVEQIPVPSWVLEEFGEDPCTPRNFSYNDMIYTDGRYDNHWLPGTDVPDLTRQEAQMWFYYRACRFIDAGYEGLHLGQIHLMTENDTPTYTNLKGLLDRIRSYAATNARRHWVFMNAHTHGIDVNGELLFDFHSFPLRPKEVVGSPYQAILEMGHLDSIYGQSLGGIAPSGWVCDNLPYVVEFDNFGGADPSNPNHDPDTSSFYVWGWDESSWFTRLSPDARDGWLWYANTWVRTNDANGYLMMPGVRPCQDPVPIGLGQLGLMTWAYRANTFNGDCPVGFNQEETIKRIWFSGCTNDSPANLGTDCDVNLYDFADFAKKWWVD